MWNNEQQQGTWWPNYNYQYQATSEDGDRSQEWAIKAAMWAQQRQMHEQMHQQPQQQQIQLQQPQQQQIQHQQPQQQQIQHQQPQQQQIQQQQLQQHPPGIGQIQPPPPAVSNYPPLPSEEAPIQPPPPDRSTSASAFVHKERLDLLEGGQPGSGSSSPWNSDQQLQNLAQQPTQQAHRKGHWKPVGGSGFDDSERPFDNYQQAPGENVPPDFPRESGQERDNGQFNDHYQKDIDQGKFHPEPNWGQSHQWGDRNWPQFPPQPEMTFPHPHMPFAPLQQPMPGLMMPNFFQPPVALHMQPKPGPETSIPDQILASQVPEINVQEMNKKKGLPQWLRDALNKKEKEKQKRQEQESQGRTIDDEESEEETKPSLEVRPRTAGIVLKENSPVRDGYSSDDEKENVNSDEAESQDDEVSNEEKAFEQMQKIKYWMMETLVTVTNEEIVSVVNEVYSRARRKARVSGELLRNSGGLAALRTGLALEYDSSSGNESDDESDEDEEKPSRWLEHEKRENLLQNRGSMSESRADVLNRHAPREDIHEDGQHRNRSRERKEPSRHSHEKKARKRARSESIESESEDALKVIKDGRASKQEYEQDDDHGSSKAKVQSKSKEKNISSSPSTASSEEEELRKRRGKTKRDSDSDDDERRRAKKKKKKRSRSSDKRSRRAGKDSDGSDKASNEKKRKKDKRHSHRDRNLSDRSDSDIDLKVIKRKDNASEKRRDSDEMDKSRKHRGGERERREERRDAKVRDKRTARSTDARKSDRKSKKKSRKIRGES